MAKPHYASYGYPSPEYPCTYPRKAEVPLFEYADNVEYLDVIVKQNVEQPESEAPDMPEEMEG